jgi:hypothetical protein
LPFIISSACRWWRLIRWPPAVWLWRLLVRAVERGEIKRDGTGTQMDPFYYWLPSLEEKWQEEPVARLM